MTEKNAGFTIVEILIVVAISVTITTALYINLSGNRNDVDHAVAVALKDIREAQTLASAAATYNNSLRCGFGIAPFPNSPHAYLIYTSPVAANNCRTQNRNYQSASDPIVRAAGVGLYSFESTFSDIFFDAPHPVTFVNNSSTSATPSRLIFVPIGANCSTTPSACRIICVYTSGRIDTGTGNSCP